MNASAPVLLLLSSGVNTGGVVVDEGPSITVDAQVEDRMTAEADGGGKWTGKGGDG